VAITIKDVAKSAGVSIATVSRVLGKSKPVSIRLEQKVKQVVEELGYVPNGFARSLITNSSKSIGVIVPKMEYSVSGTWLQGVERFSRLHGYSVILTVSEGQLDREIEGFKLMQQKRVDGLIWSAIEFSAEHQRILNNHPFPVVAIGQNFESHGLSSVVLDNRQIGYEVTRYLLSLGHRRIAMITGELRDLSSGWERLEGYRRALCEMGAVAEETLIAAGSFTMESGYICMKKLLPYGPTAVFAASDTMAIGAMNYAYEAGVSVPDQLSIIGIDNLEVSRHLNPKLSTVDYDKIGMGMAAVKLILENSQSDNNVETLTFQHHLVIRNTVKTISDV